MSGRTTVPQHPGKHDAPAVLAATDHLERLDRSFPPPPDAVVLAFRSSLVAAVARRTERRHAFAGGNLYVPPGGRVGVLGDFGFGAPVAASLVEYLAELGVEAVAVLGGAGGLQPDLGGGEVLVIESAIRDEGVSHHYLEPARTVAATPALVEGFERELAAAPVRYRVGTTWTTDAIFRETVPKSSATPPRASSPSRWRSRPSSRWPPSADWTPVRSWRPSTRSGARSGSSASRVSGGSNDCCRPSSTRSWRTRRDGRGSPGRPE